MEASNGALLGTPKLSDLQRLLYQDRGHQQGEAQVAQVQLPVDRGNGLGERRHVALCFGGEAALGEAALGRG